MGLASVRDRKMIIDGQEVGATDGAWVEVRSPATGDQAGRVPRGTASDVDRAVAAARAAFQDARWHGQWLPDRVPVLLHLADLIEANLDELVALEVAQTGRWGPAS